MRLRLAHYRNRFSMFRIYYALGAGLIKGHDIALDVIEVPDPPSRELEECLIRGEVDLANVYLPNFLERRLAGAPIIGLCTEWKSTGKGNGLFARAGEIDDPSELAGRKIATHQGRHAIHQYLLKNAYSVDPASLQWAASPQETLLGVLRRRDADAVVLLDHFFHHGEQASEVRCLYTDGDAWKRLTGFDEMIKHIIAANEGLVRINPQLREPLLAAIRDSFAYSERNMDEVADVFLAAYGGDREALLTSARYPRMEFTFTENERRLAQRQMDLFVDVGRLPRSAPIAECFAV
ncbi:MAG TPA: ABC transporter substrate-binding protein [Xanthobacteraceae bacterium]|nr:ABC transporter substrate-binding protein [Xanthobacteraceae bacterium]